MVQNTEQKAISGIGSTQGGFETQAIVAGMLFIRILSIAFLLMIRPQ